MGQWALGATWHQFPQGLGEPGYCVYLCRSGAPSPPPSLQQYLTVRPVASALGAQDICHLIVTTPVPIIMCSMPLHHPFLPQPMLFLLQYPPSVIGRHFPPLIACLPCYRASRSSLQLPAGLRCGLQATDPSLPPPTALVISSVCHELAACKREQMDSFETAEGAQETHVCTAKGLAGRASESASKPLASSALCNFQQHTGV